VRCTLRFERKLLRDGYLSIAGTDEVGRGALAGPVVAAAVILNGKRVPRGINDSKQLTRLQREELDAEIRQRALAFSIARIEHNEIDQINILRASLRAMELAIKALRPPPDYVLIDGRQKLPDLHCPQLAIVKGDCLSASGFGSHVGYNTRAHQEAIERLGPSAIHRLTFRGVLFSQASLDFGASEQVTTLSSLPKN